MRGVLGLLELVAGTREEGRAVREHSRHVERLEAQPGAGGVGARGRVGGRVGLRRVRRPPLGNGGSDGFERGGGGAPRRPLLREEVWKDSLQQVVQLARVVPLELAELAGRCEASRFGSALLKERKQTLKPRAAATRHGEHLTPAPNPRLPSGRSRGSIALVPQFTIMYRGTVPRQATSMWRLLELCGALLLAHAAGAAKALPRHAARTPAIVSRRGTLAGAAAATLLPPLLPLLPPTPLTPLPAHAATALSRDQIAAKLSRVPTFVITNRKSEPYLSESIGGQRTGAFFLSPGDAVAQLQEIRAFDASASLSIVPLDSIWFQLPKDAAEAADAAKKAPAPAGGTSSDLRRFRLAPLEAEVSAAREVLQAARGSSAKLAAGGVPLFYANELQLEVDGERRRRRSDSTKKCKTSQKNARNP